MGKNGKWHYNKTSLIDSLHSAGVEKGDILYSHVSLGRLGYPEEGSDIETACRVLHEAFMEVLGDGGTLLIPTYTYSIGKLETYDVQNTPSTVGPFTEYFRKLPNAVRSRDPMLAMSGTGPKSQDLLTGLPHTCYGEGSVYHRMRNIGAKICNVGISLYWATFRHHIEEMACVPFRFKKLFTGYICDQGIIDYESWIYFAAPFVANCSPDGMRLDKKARSIGMCKSVPTGRSEIICIDTQKYFELGMDELSRDPWFTAKGPPCSLKQLIQLENDRVHGHKHEVQLNTNASMKETIDALWYLSRDIISEGYDTALNAIANQIPIKIHNYPTGTECWSWIVPEKWTCHEAYLETKNGNRLFSYENNPLHVVSYSLPYEGVVSREVLLEHIHTHPYNAEAIPFIFKYYERDWGLCCSQKTKESLQDSEYKVKIKTDFSFGTLKVGEIIVPGESEETIVLCAHLCHPAMANDDLTGVVVGMEVMRRLRKLKLYYTYRFLVVPETIGSIAWLSHNEDLIPKIKGGLFLEMLGIDLPHSLQPSFLRNTQVDKCFINTLNSLDTEGWMGSFGMVTNDEKQFNAPGVRIPMLSLLRASLVNNLKYVYPEYHSNFDNPSIIKEHRLYESVELIVKMLLNHENNYYVKNKYKGELFCSRYGIHIDYYKNPKGNKKLFDVLYRIDGTKTVVDIANECDLYFEEVWDIVNTLNNKSLIMLSRTPC